MKNLGRIGNQLSSIKSGEIPSVIETTEVEQGKEVKVLYQRLGDQWYVFSLINEEIYYSKIGSSNEIKFQKETQTESVFEPSSSLEEEPSFSS